MRSEQRLGVLPARGSPPSRSYGGASSVKGRGVFRVWGVSLQKKTPRAWVIIKARKINLIHHEFGQDHVIRGKTAGQD